jgi:hypothetical protein
MKPNVGSVDRVARYFIALAAFGSGWYFGTWAGLIGLLPLVTALAGWCPAYSLLRLSTAPQTNR